MIAVALADDALLAATSRGQLLASRDGDAGSPAPGAEATSLGAFRAGAGASPVQLAATPGRFWIRSGGTLSCATVGAIATLRRDGGVLAIAASGRHPGRGHPERRPGPSSSVSAATTRVAGTRSSRGRRAPSSSAPATRCSWLRPPAGAAWRSAKAGTSPSPATPARRSPSFTPGSSPRSPSPATGRRRSLLALVDARRASPARPGQAAEPAASRRDSLGLPRPDQRRGGVRAHRRADERRARAAGGHRLGSFARALLGGLRHRPGRPGEAPPALNPTPEALESPAAGVDDPRAAGAARCCWSCWSCSSWTKSRRRRPPSCSTKSRPGAAPELLDDVRKTRTSWSSSSRPSRRCSAGPKKSSVTLVVPSLGDTSTPAMATVVPLALSSVPSR